QRFAHPRGNRGAVVAVQVHPGSSRLIEAWHSERVVEPEITQRLPATEIEFAGNLLLRHGQEAGIGAEPRAHIRREGRSLQTAGPGGEPRVEPDPERRGPPTVVLRAEIHGEVGSIEQV